MGLWSDLRATGRSLRRDWRFCLVAITCLAVGITAATTTFGIVDALYMRPPTGVRGAETLVQVLPSFPHLGRPMPGGAVSYPTFTTLRRAAAGTLDVAAFATGRATIEEGERVRAVTTTLVSTNYFSVLGARPSLGRFFRAHEEAPGSDVVVLDHDFWMREFGGDPQIVGRSIRLAARRYIVIGIAERRFAGVDAQHSDIWLTFGAAPEHTNWENPLATRSAFWLKQVARLGPAVSVERATEVTTLIAQEIAREEGGNARTPDRASVRLEKLRPPLLGNWGTTPSTLSAAASLSGVLTAAGLFALLMGCANVALLFLLRGFARQREIATRLAIGASRSRVIRLLATEPIILTLAAVTVGVGLSQFASRLIALVPGASGIEVAMDLRVVLFALATGFFAAVSAGVLPAVAASGLSIAESLKGAGATTGKGQTRLRHSLLLIQVVCAFVLLSTSLLLLRTSEFLRKVDVGMAVDEVVVATAKIEATLGRRTQVNRAIEDVSDRLRARADVRSMSVSEFLPFRSSLTGLAGQEPSGHDISVRFDPVDTAYFRTLGIPLLKGREFLASEVRSVTQVVVVNQTLARSWWPDGDALGRCVYIRDQTGTCRRVVGVAADALTGSLRQPAEAILYLPIGRTPLFRNLLIRTRGPAAAVLSDIRGVLSTTSAEVSEILPLRQLTYQQAETAERRAWPFLVYGLTAVLIAVVGVIALVSFVADQRATEFAIRRALGASGADLVRVALKDISRVVLLALAIGVVLASIAGSLFGNLLAGVASTDPTSHLTSAGIIVALCVAASIQPLRRVLRLPLATRLRVA